MALNDINDQVDVLQKYQNWKIRGADVYVALSHPENPSATVSPTLYDYVIIPVGIA